MRLINALELKLSIAASAVVEDGKHIFDIIDDQPTIEERKTGRWIVKPAPDKYHAGEVMCPFCKTELIADPDEYLYCPGCGARLEGDT